MTAPTLPTARIEWFPCASADIRWRMVADGRTIVQFTDQMLAEMTEDRRREYFALERRLCREAAQ